MRRRLTAAAAAAAIASVCLAAFAPPAAPPSSQAPAPGAADPYQWLEDVNGARALDWVQGQNVRARKALEGDPRYETFRKEALAIFTAEDRIPTPRLRAGAVDNLWQDAAHPRGLWRRTTLAAYAGAQPQWETVLDFDALAKAEHADWFSKGERCLQPQERLCLVRLSDGGKDAVSIREFDADRRAFVDNGFRLPESKQTVDWVDAHTLAVARDWGPGTTTRSGYPFVIKLLKRGQPLDQAKEIFRGAPSDVQVSPAVLRDPDGRVRAIVAERGVSFFKRQFFLIDGPAPVELPLPEKSELRAFVDGQVVFRLAEDWNGWRAGDLISFDLEALKRDPAAAKAVLVFRPAANQALEEVAATRDRLVVSLLEDVRGRLDVYAFKDGAWTRNRISTPADDSVQIVDASTTSNQLFFTTQGFLDPTALELADAASLEAKTLKRLPARFDASHDVVEQLWATSTDGTRIPYFLVRPKAMRLDGSTPVQMFGYGGFELSYPPSYRPEIGKLWLERGGAYVLANIRGGGEFGPAWHEAALKEHRQRAFDDFAAVAKDLIARKITSPRHLGIYGRSNGGVLMSVSMTQHPELFNAVVIESPLIDMLRYQKLSAGASWIGEYGDPDIPEQAAYIAKYSGHQNLKPGVRYPKPYITTNRKDDRVHPGHARKFAAKLEGYGDPYVFFEDNFGGHSYDADPTANAARWARHYVYLTQQLMD
jgi:prolyl oligopeptidase